MVSAADGWCLSWADSGLCERASGGNVLDIRIAYFEASVGTIDRDQWETEVKNAVFVSLVSEIGGPVSVEFKCYAGAGILPPQEAVIVDGPRPADELKVLEEHILELVAKTTNKLMGRA